MRAAMATRSAKSFSAIQVFGSPLDRGARWVVILAAAILLTFCRQLMLGAIGRQTPLDVAMNYFVVCLGPPCALYCLFLFADMRFFRLLLPVGMIIVCVGFFLALVTPPHYWPGHSHVLSIFLALFIVTQISREELPRLRRFVLLLAAMFSVVVVVYGRGLTGQALNTSEGERLGLDWDPETVLLMPRVYNVLAFTCLVSAFIEKNIWLRLAVLPLVTVPMMLTFAAASRGPVVALGVAIVVFAIGARKRIGKAVAVLFGAVVLLAGYAAVVRFFPALNARAMSGGVERMPFYQNVFQQLFDSGTILGRGRGNDYAHNIFVEFFQDYGIVGLTLFVIFLTMIIKIVRKVHRESQDLEVLWVIGLMLIQFVAQQFSLSIFIGPLWAALFLPIGLSWWHDRKFGGGGRHATQVWSSPVARNLV